jgi:hypothetical protein
LSLRSSKAGNQTSSGDSRLERIHKAVSAVFYVENSAAEELEGQHDQLESILKEEEDSAFEVFQLVGRWTSRIICDCPMCIPLRKEVSRQNGPST